MGLRNWLHNRRMDDPVDGTYTLTACSGGSSDAAYSNCRMQGVVTAPGVPPVAIEHLCTAPTRKWPMPGDVLPVTVDRADPSRLRITWDAVPGARDRAMREAARLAQQMAGQQVPPGANPFGAQPAPVGADVGRVIAAALAEQFGTPISVTVNGAAYSSGGNTLTAAEAEALVRTGEQATAVVTAVTPVEVPQALLPGPAASLADLALRVARADGTVYDASTRIGFRSPERRALVGRVGGTLPVRIDPANPARVAIDVAAFDAAHGTSDS